MYHIPQEIYVRYVEGKRKKKRLFYAQNVTQTSPRNQYDISRRRYDKGHACMDKNQTFAKKSDMFSET